MGVLYRTMAIAVLTASAAGCGVTPATDQRAALADPFPDLVFGAVADFPDGQITAVESPRAVFVTWIDGGLVVFDRKDPNNGCRLQLAVDVDPESATGVPTGATYWDACHGQAYDAAGGAIGDVDARPIYRLEVVVRDRHVVWLR